MRRAHEEHAESCTGSPSRSSPKRRATEPMRSSGADEELNEEARIDQLARGPNEEASTGELDQELVGEAHRRAHAEHGMGRAEGRGQEEEARQA